MKSEAAFKTLVSVISDHLERTLDGCAQRFSEVNVPEVLIREGLSNVLAHNYCQNLMDLSRSQNDHDHAGIMSSALGIVYEHMRRMQRPQDFEKDHEIQFVRGKADLALRMRRAVDAYVREMAAPVAD